jgi:hypothetical protein
VPPLLLGDIGLADAAQHLGHARRSGATHRDGLRLTTRCAPHP